MARGDDPAATSGPRSGRDTDRPVGGRRHVAARDLGVWSLWAFVLLLLTGVPLSFLYVAAPGAAHASVTRIADGAWGVVRAMHAWAATAGLALALVHLARAYVTARIATIGRTRALAGLLALAVVVASFLLGTMLPWDQQGWEAYQHLHAAGAALGVGAVPEDPSAAPLGAVFWLHIVGGSIVLGVLLVRHVGIGAGVGAAARRVWRLVVVRGRGVAVLSALVVLAAVLWPPELGPAALPGLVVTRPDWPFLWLVPLQDLLGPAALWLVPLLFVVAGVALWRQMQPALGVRRAVTACLAILLLGLTVLAWR